MRNRRTLCILAVAAIITLARVAVAQEDTWTSGGPYDAPVWSIAIDPTDSQHLFIGTLGNFLFQTTDGGTEWSHIPGSPDPDGNMNARTVRVVKIHPFGPDTVFIATGRGAYKSIDAGQSWSRLPLQWPISEWNRMELSRTDPPVLFVGNGFPGGLFRSTDSGESWLPIGGPGSMKAIKADPINPNIIYIAAGSIFWKSTDSGATWQAICQISGYNRDIEVDPVDPEIIYIAREATDALIKSTDGGESWTDITPPDLSENWLYNVEVAPLDHNTIIVCSREDGVLRSTDGGETWEEANQGIVGARWRAQTLTSDHEIGIIYLGMYAGGIYRSTDDGASWEKISYNVTGAKVWDIAVNFRNPDTLYTATHNGLYISTTGGTNWEPVIYEFPNRSLACGGVAVDPYDPSFVYCSGYAEQYTYRFCRSIDGGATWEPFTQGLRSDGIYSEIAVADYGGGSRRLFMASYQGLFSSDDLGESWSLCQGGLPSDICCENALAVSSINPDLVFVGEPSWSSGRLYKTTDGGESWEPLINSPSGTHLIACDPVNPDIVYTTAGDILVSEMYKSTDGGQNWAVISDDIPRDSRCPVLSGLAVNPLNPDNIFALSYNRGFFQSHDGGGSWEDFNLNLETTVSIGRTVIDPIDTSRIFLGLSGRSVWSITRTQTGIDVADNILPTSFSASSYPNPFNPSATIEYSLPEEAFVTVDIYDLLGRKVETLVSRDQRAGSYRVVWDAKDRASGLYFYKIDIGESSEIKKMILLK